MHAVARSGAPCPRLRPSAFLSSRNNCAPNVVAVRRYAAPRKHTPGLPIPPKGQQLFSPACAQYIRALTSSHQFKTEEMLSTLTLPEAAFVSLWPSTQRALLQEVLGRSNLRWNGKKAKKHIKYHVYEVGTPISQLTVVDVEDDFTKQGPVDRTSGWWYIRTRVGLKHIFLVLDARTGLNAQQHKLLSMVYDACLVRSVDHPNDLRSPWTHPFGGIPAPLEDPDEEIHQIPPHLRRQQLATNALKTTAKFDKPIKDFTREHRAELAARGLLPVEERTTMQIVLANVQLLPTERATHRLRAIEHSVRSLVSGAGPHIYDALVRPMLLFAPPPHKVGTAEVREALRVSCGVGELSLEEEERWRERQRRLEGKLDEAKAKREIAKMERKKQFTQKQFAIQNAAFSQQEDTLS